MGDKATTPPLKNNPAKPKRGGPRPGAGRPKGVPNKVSGALKDMILAALEQAHAEGAIGYLKKQASEQPVAFMGLIGKVLPTTLAGSAPDGAIVHRIELVGVVPK